MQKTNSELLHISLVMLVTALFYLWFAWDAIVFENAFELAACGVLGLAVCARIIYFVVRTPDLNIDLPFHSSKLRHPGYDQKLKKHQELPAVTAGS